MKKTREEWLRDFWNSPTGQSSWKYGERGRWVAERVYEDMQARNWGRNKKLMAERIRDYFKAEANGTLCTGYNFGFRYRDGEQRCTEAGRYRCGYCGDWRCSYHMERPFEHDGIKPMCNTTRHS